MSRTLEIHNSADHTSLLKDGDQVGAIEPSAIELWEHCMADFLTVELRTGQTFAHMASTTEDPRKKNWYIVNSRKAYDTILRFMARADFSKMADEMRELQFSLERLGEKGLRSIDDHPERPKVTLRSEERSTTGDNGIHKSLFVRVQLFEKDCRQVRADAQLMAQQNRHLMNRKA
jgi:hypothetical protein